MEFDEDAGIHHPPENSRRSGREMRKNTAAGRYRYRECLKNHALGIGGHALDGCGEFMAAGDDGTLDGLKCAACNCHRNFHRKEAEGQQQQYITSPPYYHHHQDRPAGYLQMTPALYSHHQRPPLSLPSTSREDLEEISNPSSSGGGSGSKKRFRTKFTAEQKDRMMAFSEALGWRIQKHDEAAVLQFCAETGVKRHVLKVWMHNNKHTTSKKP
ncbi:hypothetical protein R6Q59_031714 [Mikania micrantha]